MGIDPKLSTIRLKPAQGYDLWASGYPPYAHSSLMKAEERAMLSLMPADLSGSRVLDAGCGSGRYLSHAAQRRARRLIGVDFSAAMLVRALKEWSLRPGKGLGQLESPIAFLQASLEAMPLKSDWADLTICALTLGHFPDLALPLAELRRVTNPGGTILCSDLHPLGFDLGWQRNFKVGQQSYAIDFTPHPLTRWQESCDSLKLKIVKVMEPYLHPGDIPDTGRFDPRGLSVPVALVLALRREE
jgi:malonyl-CoA O-methyltransferase